MPFNIIIIIFYFFIQIGCTTYKNYTYIQNLKNDTIILSTQLENYKLQIGDILLINIHTPNNEINAIFNQINLYNLYNINPTNLYYLGYCIDDNGEINMPIIGNVHVHNKTIKEINEIITEKLGNYLSNFHVSVKYGGFKITVLGEVKNPGEIYFFRNKINILEVLSKAGDLTDFANRKNIILLRKENNKFISHTIDLTSKEFILNKNFFVQPNDIIYVPPVKIKFLRQNLSNLSIVLSAITSILVITNFILGS